MHCFVSKGQEPKGSGSRPGRVPSDSWLLVGRREECPQNTLSQNTSSVKKSKSGRSRSESRHVGGEASSINKHVGNEVSLVAVAVMTA